MRKYKLTASNIKGLLSPRDFYTYELNSPKLKKVSWNEGGLCPFHADNKSGSFYVNLETGAYKCFACGEVGGDVVAFSMSLYGLKFSDALEKLACDWSLT